jgi:YjbE family integral membrane protein
MGFDWEFVARWISIVVLDLTLAGDNAVVIALAVRTLPRRQQRLGIFWGAMAAVVLRVAVTFVAAQLLRVPLLQFGGGILLLWIAWKLLRQEEVTGEHGARGGTTLFEAIKIIALADFIMSTDNMLAVAAASRGSFFLLMFGLGLSIPIIMAGSALVARLMQRYKWLVALGAGILGWVAGEMMVADRLIHPFMGAAASVLERAVPAILGFAFVAAGLVRQRRARRRAAAAARPAHAHR